MGWDIYFATAPKTSLPPLALLSILISRRVMTRVEGTASTRYKFSKCTYIHCGEPHIQKLNIAAVKTYSDDNFGMSDPHK